MCSIAKRHVIAVPKFLSRTTITNVSFSDRNFGQGCAKFKGVMVLLVAFSFDSQHMGTELTVNLMKLQFEVLSVFYSYTEHVK